MATAGADYTYASALFVTESGDPSATVMIPTTATGPGPNTSFTAGVSDF